MKAAQSPVCACIPSHGSHRCALCGYWAQSRGRRIALPIKALGGLSRVVMHLAHFVLAL